MTSVISLSYLSNKLQLFCKLQIMLADHVTILPADAFKDPSNQIYSTQDSNRSPPVQCNPTKEKVTKKISFNSQSCLAINTN